MIRRRFLGFLAGLLVAAGVIGPTTAQPNWVLLGARTVNILIEQDTIPVTLSEGLFTAIGIRVRGNDLYVSSVRINFGNGESQDRVIDANVPQGGERVLDLVGNTRVVSSITLSYRRPINLQGDTIVEIWGRR